jgi:hypothetical protein
MVSALTQTRLIASQMALQLLQSSDPSQDDSNDPLLDDSSGNDLSSLPSQSQAGLAVLLNNLPSSQTDATGGVQDDTANPDLDSDAFMTLLKQNLQDAVKAEGPNGQAQAMLDALDKGTLTISSPPDGTSVTAWDPDTADSQDAADKQATTGDATDWNDFLKQHLQRGSDGTFAKNSDGSFTDKTTGDEAYFGQVGSQFYYITWPGAGSSSDASDANAPASGSTGKTSA